MFLRWVTTSTRPVRDRDAHRIQRRLPPHLGRLPRQDPPCPGQPRVRQQRCGRLLQLLRRKSRRTDEGLLLAQRRFLAHRRPELRVLAGGRVSHRLPPGAMAASRPCRQHRALHTRLLAPSPVQQRQRQFERPAAVPGPLRRQRRARSGRTRPFLRTVRATESQRRPGHGPRDSSDRRRYRRQELPFVRNGAGQLADPQQQHVRCPQGDTEGRQLRLAVHARHRLGRRDVHRLGVGQVDRRRRRDLSPPRDPRRRPGGSPPAEAAQPVPGHTGLAPSTPRTNTPRISTGEIWDIEVVGNRVFIAGTSRRCRTAPPTTPRR
jgi:hypothetical protein